MRHRVFSVVTLVYSGSRPRKVTSAVAVPPQAKAQTNKQTNKHDSPGHIGRIAVLIFSSATSAKNSGCSAETLSLRTMAEQLAYRGTLKGHENWVTAIATSLENDRMVVSASRDKSIIVYSPRFSPGLWADADPSSLAPRNPALCLGTRRPFVIGTATTTHKPLSADLGAEAR